MSARCDQLTAYLDAALDAAEVDAFERHLASCDACQRASHDALQLAALEAAARLEGRRAPLADALSTRRSQLAGRRPRAWAIAGAGFAAAAALAIAWWARRAPEAHVERAIALLTSPVRGNEARISYAPAAMRVRATRSRSARCRSSSATGISTASRPRCC